MYVYISIAILLDVVGICFGSGSYNDFLSDRMTLCRGRVDGQFHAPSDCSKYVVCNNERATVQDCPPGLLFNKGAGICDFAYNTDCNLKLHQKTEPEANVFKARDKTPVSRIPLANRRGKARKRKVYYETDFSNLDQSRDSPFMWDSQSMLSEEGDSVTYSTPARRSQYTPVSSRSYSDWTPYEPETENPVTQTTRSIPRGRNKQANPSLQDTVHVDVPDVSQSRIRSYGKSSKKKVYVECSEDGLFPHPDNCGSYIQCARNVAYFSECPEGTYFNPEYRHCGYSDVACHAQTHSKEEDLDYSQEEDVEIKERSRNKDVVLLVKAAMANAMQEAKVKITRMMKEEAHKASHMTYSRGAFGGVQSFLGATTLVKQMSLPAEQQLLALKIIKKKFNLSKEEMAQIMGQMGDLLRHPIIAVKADMANPKTSFDVCPYPSNTAQNKCDKWTKYRSQDGSCNNLDKPLWGKSFRAYGRSLQPDYADGISDPREGHDGRKLPSARQVSWQIHEDQDAPSHVHTILMMTFGQFVDHDMTRTAITKLNKDPKGSGEMVDVKCGEDGCETSGVENRACLPIPVSRQDPSFHSKKCLMFVRTQEVLGDECHPAPRDQMNQLTSYLDAAQVYGNTKEQADLLRDKSDPGRGKLKVTPHPVSSKYRPLLPQKDVKDCRDVNATIKCFGAGDGRVNEQIGLTAIHTAYHRYHNYLEEKLHQLNPHWQGDKLYHEVRRIIGAIWQYQVYQEYLPLVLGPHKMQEFGLNLAKNAFYDAYDKKVSADSTNSFATAAFRFSHSNIDSLITFMSQTFKESQEEELSKVLRRPYEIYNDRRPGGPGVDSIIMGQTSHPLQTTDRFFSRQITTRLFSENPPTEVGHDLISLNINRGRDHGLPGYNAWREWCGLPRATSFDTLYDLPPDVRQKFKKLYKHVDDIDLYPAAVSEQTVAGGVVGPTFACIIGRQFRRTRVGDRFWFEREDPVTGFTKEQLEEIRKVTVSKVICDTCDNVVTIQKYVMLQPLSEAFTKMGRKSFYEAYSLASLYRGENNERRPCSEFPDLDITKWAD